MGGSSGGETRAKGGKKTRNCLLPRSSGQSRSKPRDLLGCQRALKEQAGWLLQEREVTVVKKSGPRNAVLTVDCPCDLGNKHFLFSLSLSVPCMHRGSTQGAHTQQRCSAVQWHAAHLPAFLLFELDVLARLGQQLLHFEHIAGACIGAGLEGDLGIPGDPLTHCLGYLHISQKRLTGCAYKGERHVSVCYACRAGNSSSTWAPEGGRNTQEAQCLWAHKAVQELSVSEGRGLPQR